MIPFTFPSTQNRAGMSWGKVDFLSSVTGLTRWVDYIPVKRVAYVSSGEGTTNANGFQTVAQVATSMLVKWSDYIPVYEDAAATSPFTSGANGYIPVNEMLDLDFLGGALPSTVTFTRADATTCATYFDSTGRLQTAAANVPRFDYDPATPLGVTGGELVTNGDFSQGTTGWVTFGTAGNVSVTNGQLRINAADGVNSGIQQTTFLTVGVRYRLTFDLISVNGTGIQVNDTIGPVYGTYTSAGTQTLDFIAGTSSIQFKRVSGVVDATLDNISIKVLTYTPRGLLIEEARTNLLLHSRDMTQAAWGKTDATSTRNQVGITGEANTACLMTEGSAGTALAYQVASVAAGSTISGSIVVKRGNTDWFCLYASGPSGTNGAQAYFNLATGAKGSTLTRGAGTNNSSTIQPLGGGWYRCTITTTPDGSYTNAQIFFASASADGNGTRVNNATYIVDCAQLEVGASDESTIPTGGTIVTRARDSAVMPGAAFSSWYNPLEGTFVAEVVVPANVESGVYPTILEANDGTTNNRLLVFLQTGATEVACMRVDTGGVVQVNTSAGGPGVTQGSVSKVAFAYAANDFAISQNGGAVGTDAVGTVPTVNQLNIGCTSIVSTRQIYIRRITYYPTRLPNQTLQALTA